MNPRKAVTRFEPDGFSAGLFLGMLLGYLATQMKGSDLKLPKEIRDQFAEQGRRGGKAKVPKGFAKMDPKKRANVARKGGKAKGVKAKTNARKRSVATGNTGNTPDKT